MGGAPLPLSSCSLGSHGPAQSVLLQTLVRGLDKYQYSRPSQQPCYEPIHFPSGETEAWSVPSFARGDKADGEQAWNLNSDPLATEPELLTAFLTFSEPRRTLLQAPGRRFGQEVRRVARGHGLPHPCPPAQALPASGLIPCPRPRSLPYGLRELFLAPGGISPHRSPCPNASPLFYPSANSWG